jgi:hypothetical protein
MRGILEKEYGHQSSKQLNINEYNKLCDWLESKPMPAQSMTSEDKFDDAFPMEEPGNAG